MSIRGNEVYYDTNEKKWKWSDGSDDLAKPCVKCKEYPVDDVDYCLQGLKDCEMIHSACCGHGNDVEGYILLKDGRLFKLYRECERMSESFKIIFDFCNWLREQGATYETINYLTDLTFLYRCVDDIALTTKELKKECPYE